MEKHGKDSVAGYDCDPLSQPGTRRVEKTWPVLTNDASRNISIRSLCASEEGLDVNICFSIGLRCKLKGHSQLVHMRTRYHFKIEKA